jgi:DNA-binding NarL/FixJ family response regulator
MEPPLHRALVVEDDRSWQEILTEILNDAGLTVDVAADLDAAITTLKSMPHRLAVVDLSLGHEDHRNLDGLQILDAVRRHDPGCVALLLTGHATVELAVSALTEHGAFTCLRKEAFRRAEFRDVVRQALAGTPAFVAQSGTGDAGPTEAGRMARPETPAAGGAGLALVVEDDAGWRSILSELLAQAGFQVHPCRSYGEALGCLRRDGYRLAVVDLTLANSLAPDDNADGLRLLASTSQAGIPAIVVSGSALPADIEQAYETHGIVSFLEKQAFDRQAFRRALDAALAAARPPFPELELLTEREAEVLDLLAQGMTNKEMADALVISENTVKRHLKAIFAKLEVNTRSAAVAKVLAAGFRPG